MGKQIVILLIFLGSLTSFIAFWVIQIPQPGLSTAEADNWQLPTLPQTDQLNASRNKLNKLKPWGNLAKKKPAKKQKTWKEIKKERSQKAREKQQQREARQKEREQKQEEQEAERLAREAEQRKQAQKRQLVQQFKGIVQQGNERYILLLDDKQQLTPYYLGSTLPQGFELIHISEDFIEVLQKDNIENIPLY